MRAKWPASHLESYPLKNHPDLSIDWLWTEPRDKENLVVISTAEHGIEGYVGSAMLKLFMNEFANLNSGNTGLLLVHAINPWGMKNRYRVNPNDVDLNRNFVFDGQFSPAINPNYDSIGAFLNPQQKVRTLGLERIAFLFQIVRNLIQPGRTVVQAASLFGQHRHPKGVFYGGMEYQEEALVLMMLYRMGLAEFFSTTCQILVYVRNETGRVVAPVAGHNCPRVPSQLAIPALGSTTRTVTWDGHGEFGAGGTTTRLPPANTTSRRRSRRTTIGPSDFPSS